MRHVHPRELIRIFTNLGIGTKLPLVALFFLFPIALFAYFLCTEKNEQIQFTTREIAGLHYLTAAYEVLAVTTVPTTNAATWRDAAAALNQAELADNGRCDVTDKTSELSAMLRTAGQGQASEQDVTGRVTDLMSAVADNSNITLDPDTSAYFVGDLIANQAPGVLTQTAALLKAAQAIDKEPSDDNKIAYAEARDDLYASAANLVTDTDKAIEGDSTCALQAALDPGKREVTAAVDQVVDMANTTNRTGLQAAAADLRGKLLRYVATSNHEMEGLLNARLAGFYTTIITRLGIAVAAVVVGGLAFIAVIHTITRPMIELIEITSRLADGDTSVQIPRYDRADEIGQLSRALSVFQKNMDAHRRPERQAKEAEATMAG